MSQPPTGRAGRTVVKDPAATSRASRRIMIFGGLMILTLVVQGFNLPWRMLTVATGIAGVVYGILALRAVWTAGTRGIVLPALIAGVLMTGFMAFATGLLVFVWQIEVDFQDCRASAITVSATEQCAADYKAGLNDWRSSIERRAKGGAG